MDEKKYLNFTNIRRDLVVLLCLTITGLALAADNPFLRIDIPDSGVLKYNGEYYLCGWTTKGYMYCSRNLVDWGNRTKAITHVAPWSAYPYNDDWIGVSDLNYVNGVFHHYFQIDNKIGHAVASSPLGMYTEPVTNSAFALQIDPNYFRDDNGSQYFYMVKFPGGSQNAIYGQTISDPATLTGSAVQMLTALTGTWERQPAGSTPINEGPAVFKYRGRYYMLYAANSTTSSNYSIGCGEAATPMGFANSGKYSAPLLTRTSVGSGEINTMGQPWVVDGPNGFEKWVGYFAVYTPDGGGRYQCVDRIHFFDRKLTVDGPTSRYTAGYHPGPAKPTLLNLFDGPNGALPAADWTPLGAGGWDVLNHEARQTNQSTWSLNPVNRDAAVNYLIEASVKFNDAADGEDKVGVLTYYQDASNWMIVGIDRIVGNWYSHRQEAGVNTIVSGALPSGWNHSVYHKIRVSRNGTQFDVRLDDMTPLGGQTPINIIFTAAGRPGIYTDHTSASFDGVIYTIGWDEYDAGVRGWGATLSGIPVTGNWNYVTNGIFLTNATGFNYTFKGDLMAQYEFSTQVYRSNSVPADGQIHSMGIMPVAIDANNYLAAEINLTNSTIFTYGMTNGVALPPQSAAVTAANNYNLRAVKLTNSVILFVNGVQMLTVNATFGPSQVGLVNQNISARYNGILVYRTEPLSVPSPWQSQDLGTVGFAGSADYGDGTFVVNGSGADFWDVSDSGHFVYQPMSDNGQIIARLDSLDPTGWWAKAGLMFREDMSTSGRMAIMIINGAGDGNGDQHQFIWRENPGWGTPILVHTNSGSTPLLPQQCWLKLTRQGNTFTGYYSTNGTVWNVVGSSTVSMAAMAYVGLAVTAQNNTRVCGAVFDNVAITPGTVTTTTLSSSLNASTYGQSITVTATVSPTPSGGTVQLYDNGVALGGAVAVSVGNGQASFTTNKLAAGSHPITAVYSGTTGYFGSSTVSAMTQTVNQAALTITGNNTNKLYGQTVTFAGTEFTAGGLVSGDSVTSVTLTSSGTATNAQVSNYPIYPSAAVGSGLSNYAINYVLGILTVNSVGNTPGYFTYNQNDAANTFGQWVIREPGWDRYLMFLSCSSTIVKGKPSNQSPGDPGTHNPLLTTPGNTNWWADRIWVTWSYGDGRSGWDSDTISPMLLLSPNGASTNQRCLIGDPSVVLWQGQWHMYYEGTDNSSGLSNHLFHATASSWTGPWTSQGEAQGLWGATNGSGLSWPTVMVDNGQLALYFTDGGVRLMAATNTDTTGHNFAMVNYNPGQPLNYTDNPLPVMVNVTANRGTVKYFNGAYQLVHDNVGRTTVYQRASTNKFDFTASPPTQLLCITNGDWYNVHVGLPSFCYGAYTNRIYFTGSQSNDVGGSQSKIGYYEPHPTTTALASSLDPSTYGTAVTLTATVTTPNGIPAGTVTFMEGVTTLGTGALGTGSGNTATATLTRTNLMATTHSLIASYGGDANFIGSVSSALSQVVNRKPLTVAGVTAANKVYDGGTNATLNGTAALVGVVSGDTVTPGGTPVASFGDKIVGTAKTVSVTGYTLVGASATNYSLTQPTLSADITARPVALSGTRVYDGTAAAAAAAAAAILTIGNNLDGVNLTLTGSGALASWDVGLQAISAGTLALGGSAASNYTLTGLSGSVTITAASSTTALASSLNPAPTGTNVMFTATVSAVPPGAGTPTNLVQFLTNGVAAALANLSGSAQAIYATSLLPHGSNIVTAEYVSDGNFLASTNSLLQVVNTAPVANPFSLGAVSGLPATLPVIGSTNVADADGDPLTVTAVSAPAHGIAGTDGTHTTYTATNNFVGTDSFNFRVSDNYGDAATNTVTVSVIANSAGLNRLTAGLSSGNVVLTYLGIPWNNYALEQTLSLSPRVWLPVVTTLAPANGYLMFTNPPQPGANSFWRTRLVP